MEHGDDVEIYQVEGFAEMREAYREGHDVVFERLHTTHYIYEQGEHTVSYLAKKNRDWKTSITGYYVMRRKRGNEKAT